MAPDVLPIYATLQQCWELLYSEHNRLERELGSSPIRFESPKHAAIAQYVPKDGDEIYFGFWDSDHKQKLLSVEVELIPSGIGQYQVFVHAHGNLFEEPLKSALQIWMQIKNAMMQREYLNPPDVAQPKISPPIKPERAENLTAWFDWYHARLASGFKTTLAEIADATGYQEGTVRQKHSTYTKERGLLKPRKRTNKK